MVLFAPIVDNKELIVVIEHILNIHKEHIDLFPWFSHHSSYLLFRAYAVSCLSFDFSGNKIPNAFPATPWFYSLQLWTTPN